MSAAKVAKYQALAWLLCEASVQNSGHVPGQILARAASQRHEEIAQICDEALVPGSLRIRQDSRSRALNCRTGSVVFADRCHTNQVGTTAIAEHLKDMAEAEAKGRSSVGRRF